MIKRFLLWALSKFEDPKPAIEAWPFPVGHEPQLVVKKKPQVKKATTRPAKKKPAVAIKTARTKKAK